MMSAMMVEMMMGNSRSTAEVKNNLSWFRKGLTPYILEYSGYWHFLVRVPTGSYYLGDGKRPVPFDTIVVNHSFEIEQYEIALHYMDGGRIQLDIDGSSRNLGVDPQFVIDTIKHLITTGYLNSEDIPDDVQGGAP